MTDQAISATIKKESIIMKLPYYLIILWCFLACGGSKDSDEKESQENFGVWRQIPSPTTENLFDTTRLFNDDLLVVGSNGTLLNSNDGGKNWKKIDLETKKNLNVVKMVNSLVYIGGDSIFLLSIDEGKTFSQVSGIDFEINDMGFTSSDDGAFIVVGSKGNIARASFKGKKLEEIRAQDLQWQKIDSETEEGLNGISLSFNRGIIAGNNGFITVTEDTGMSFSFDTNSTVKSSFLTIDDEYLAGDKFFARRYTPNGFPVGSIAWENKTGTSLPVFKDLLCISNCLALGKFSDGFAIFNISETGEILEMEATKINSPLNSIGYAADQGYITVGDEGKILLRAKKD